MNLQFAQGFPNMEAPRPFGQVMPQMQGFMPDSAPNNWLHVTPAHMPWGIPMANQPAIVRFTAEPSTSQGNGIQQMPDQGHCNLAFQCKRKCEIDDLPEPELKMHISEERMAAHMSQLHISPPSGEPSTAMPSMPPTGEAEEPQQQLKRLVLCEEIRRLRAEPVLPSSLLCRLEKPSMALVLWQPPAGQLGSLLKSAVRGDGAREEEEESLMIPAVPDNNNSIASPDLNTLGYPHGFQVRAQAESEMDL